ncbi:MAG: PASTA domain-containing protein [Parvicellaceae bacterium]|tara:strand:+ start:1930 stop:2685 length:756 start_codon:yes stop_codon:yes gene_type:complete
MRNLDTYTNHSVKIQVPNLKGIQLSELDDSLKLLEIEYKIRDSVFSDDYPTGMIIQQDPLPHSEDFPNYIKPNRTIYLTIVKKQEIYKIIPDLLSYVTSKNIGKSKLEKLGFKVELEVKDHKDKDKVLELRYENEVLKTGKKLVKGSIIKLIFGSGDKGKPIELPDFKGMNIYLATQKASEIGLDLEVQYYDSVLNLKDSNFAVVYSQYPDPLINNKSLISIGSVVTINANLTTPLDSIYAKDTVSLNFDN